MSRAPKLVIEPRTFGAVVKRRGRVIFRSSAIDAHHECREFVRRWSDPEQSQAAALEGAISLAESVQW